MSHQTAKTISIIASGDSFINRHLPPADKAARQLSELVNSADVRFTNLETVLRRNEGFPSAQSGGTWASSAPEVLGDLREYGFNALAWANNHTLDYSYGGLLATQHYIEEYNFIHAGAGRDLSEASAIKYLECAGGRVAIIAGTATFHESWAAGDQRPDVTGRPGVNPLHFQKIYRVSAAQLKDLRAIAAKTGINAEYELRVKEGFAAPDDKSTFRFGTQLFQLAANGKVGETSFVNARDMHRFAKRIEDARRSADIVLVSIHAHEMQNARKDVPADFLVEFARNCIDKGAHAVIGHGPHILRGVEIYRNRPIFYSLGNFIFQNDTVAHLPADFYEKQGLSSEHSVVDALEKRSNGGKRGLGVNPDVWRSVVARWEMQKGKLAKLELFPIDLGFRESVYQRGWPRLTEDVSALENLRDLSAAFDTEIVIEDGVGKVLLSR
jgi:poly-gamma-glutamate synthesis protein (capsule biosynthesis protein)